MLTRYSWPGNVRELATWVERLYVTGMAPKLLMEMLFQETSGEPLLSIRAGRGPDVEAGRAASDRLRVGTIELQSAQGGPLAAGASRRRWPAS